MKPATRTSQLKESAVRKYIPLAEAATARGLEVLRLNIGQPDTPTPDAFWQALKNLDLKTLGYAHSAGLAELRAAIAHSYADYGLAAQHVLITAGGSEALSFAFHSCLDMGQEILVFEPFYSNYRTLAQISGVSLRAVATTLADDFRLPALTVIEEQLGAQTKAILISNPDNPTGKVYSETELRMLLTLADKHDLWLIVDEVYRDFVYDQTSPTPSIYQFATAAQRERIVVIESISKKFSACGARVGAVLSTNTALNQEMLKLAQARLAVATVDQLGALAIYESDQQEYLREAIASYAQRQQILFKGLQEIPGVKVPQVGGAFYLVAELPVADSEEFCRWLLTDFSENGQTLLLTPAKDFYTSAAGKSQVRICYAVATGKLERAIELLKVALARYTEAQ